MQLSLFGGVMCVVPQVVEPPKRKAVKKPAKAKVELTDLELLVLLDFYVRDANQLADAIGVTPREAKHRVIEAREKHKGHRSRIVTTRDDAEYAQAHFKAKEVYSNMQVVK